MTPAGSHFRGTQSVTSPHVTLLVLSLSTLAKEGPKKTCAYMSTPALAIAHASESVYVCINIVCIRVRLRHCTCERVGTYACECGYIGACVSSVCVQDYT